MLRARTLALPLALLMLAISCRALADSSPREIITRNASGPVIVWDATPQIQQFLARNIPLEQGVAKLKVGALDLFVRGAHGFAKNEHHLSVMVVYARAGAMSARYQTKSFQGIGNALSLEGSPRVHLGSQWRPQAQQGHFPPGITIRVFRPSSEP